MRCPHLPNVTQLMMTQIPCNLPNQLASDQPHRYPVGQIADSPANAQTTRNQTATALCALA